MSTPDAGPTRTDASAPSLQALERLRDRVEAAAREIERLRQENERLAERVQELAALEAARPEDGGPLPTLVLESDPEALRRKVEGFIEAIDRVLAGRPPADAEEEGEAEEKDETPAPRTP